MKLVAVLLCILGASLALEPENRSSDDKAVLEVVDDTPVEQEDQQKDDEAVGDSPVEQEDQQENTDTSFRQFLIQKQPKPAQSQIFRVIPQQQNLFAPQIAQYEQFRAQPVYLLNPFAVQHSNPSYQTAKIYRRPQFAGFKGQIPAIIQQDQYSPSYQTAQLYQQPQSVGFQGQVPTPNPRFFFKYLKHENGIWYACKFMLGCVELPFGQGEGNGLPQLVVGQGNGLSSITQGNGLPQLIVGQGGGISGITQGNVNPGAGTVLVG
ncbi:uncharacterized protein LOC136038902 [Artemia franciscana]|uniref:Uncharacterized protein n=1 Tax=Artemia franciscana TaxID=6661 RepID=A0AA88L9W6_ARTSF|nr:hypothetical protein QYM36_006413 [Artemia franciscana]